MKNTLADFKALLGMYGNASFDCGEHDGETPEYEALLVKMRDTKKACMGWVKKYIDKNSIKEK